MSVNRLHLGKGTETEIMSDEERIAWAISSLIAHFQNLGHSKGTAMAQNAQEIFAGELQMARTSLAYRPVALGPETEPLRQ